jgi:hypothetical protein
MPYVLQYAEQDCHDVYGRTRKEGGSEGVSVGVDRDQHDYILSLYTKYKDRVKPGRWIYCKYCYKNRKPIVSWYPDFLIKCSKCNYGLWPLQDEEMIEEWITNIGAKQ